MEHVRAANALMQQPFSCQGHRELHGHVQAALLMTTSTGGSGMQTQQRGNHVPSLCQMLQLSNKYLQWTFDGLPDPSAAHLLSYSNSSFISGNSSSNSSSGGGGGRSSGGSSSSRSGGPAPVQADITAIPDAQPADGLMFTLMVLWEALKAASLAKTAGGQEWVAVASLHMLAPGTGTMSLLARAATWLLAALTPGHISFIRAACVTMNAWLTAFSLTAGTTPGSLISCMVDGRVGESAQQLPPMAGLLQCYLQAPAGPFSNPAQASGFMQLMAQHAAGVVASSASARDGLLLHIGETRQPPPPSQRGTGKQGPSGGAVGVVEGLLLQALLQEGHVLFNLPAGIRAQIEALLWNVLATAAAALQAVALQSTTGTAPTNTASSGSRDNSSGCSISSSSKSSRGGSSNPHHSSSNIHNSSSSSSVVMPMFNGVYSVRLPHDGYKGSQLGQGDAEWLCYHAAVALLQLGLYSQKHGRLLDNAGLAGQQTAGQAGQGSAGAGAAPQRDGSLMAGPPAAVAAANTTDRSNSSKTSINNQPTATHHQQQQQQQQPAWYVCCPGALSGACSKPLVGGSRSTDATITGSSRGSSSSTGAMVCEEDVYSGVDARLQLLASAASTCLSHLQHSQLPGAQVQFLELGSTENLLGMLLVLLVQQLQCAPAQVRGRFLNGPAGSTVLRVFSDLITADGLDLVGRYVTRSAWLVATQQQQQQQQGVDNAAAGEFETVGGRAMDELLLPGLLLQAAPHPEPCTQHSSGCSSRASQELDAGTDCGSCSCRISGAGHIPVMLRVAGVWAPLCQVPHSGLQLPQEFVPPPQAIILVEQLLRRAPSTEALSLAVHLLQGSASHILAASQQQLVVGSAAEQGTIPSAVGQKAAAAKLHMLAYCSLASTVVQFVQYGLGTPQLGAELASGLTDVLIGLAGLAGVAPRSGGSSSSNQGLGRSESAGWSLAASLAASTALAAYVAHLRAAASSDSPQADCALGPEGPAGACTALSSASTDPAESGSSSRDSGGGSSSFGSAAGNSSSSGGGSSGGSSGGGSSSRATGAASDSSGPSDRAACGHCPDDCSVCAAAEQRCALLHSLERSAAPWLACSAGDLAALADAAGPNPHIPLLVQLGALAQRHPVPGVCGNPFCSSDRKAAPGMVRGLPGTLCGHCRATRYCCEACQKAAWYAHQQVCRSRSH